MKDLISAIFNIFRWTGKIFTIIRNTILNLSLLLLLLFICITLFASSAPKEPLIQRDSGLILTIAGIIVEEKQVIDPIEEFINDAMGAKNPYHETLLQDIIDAISHAKNDPNISYLLLDLDQLAGAGLPQLERITQSIQDFKKSGKKVIAAEDFYTQSQYYLAAHADTIILNPMGGVDLHGFGVYRLYFKDILDKLKVNYNIFRVGSHKSALEPVFRTSMSKEDREQNRLWLTSLWKSFTTSIIMHRHLPEETITQYTDNNPEHLAKVNGNTADLALEMGLIDKILTRHEVTEYLASLSTKVKTKKTRTVSLKTYLSTIQQSYLPTDSDNKIGIIIAQGTILPGEQPIGTIGSETLASMIRKAGKDKNIKAVVLRIDSGGGSAYASELIRQELLELQRKGKQVVVSMGNIAASGGYWIAADADMILAAPSTITGSIGIFGAIPTFEKSLAAIGIQGDGIGTTNLSTGINITLPLAEDIKKSIQLTIENGYDNFIDIVATGRDMNKENVKQLAEGKVYSGSTALEIGLVDKLGYLDDAVINAAELAGIDDYTAVRIQRELNLKEKLFSQLQKNAFSNYIAAFLSSVPQMNGLYSPIAETQQILNLEDPRHIYAHSLLSNNYIH